MDEDAGRDDPAEGAPAETGPGTGPPRGSDRPPVDDEFGWRGWALVGVLLVAFLVAPLALLYLPTAQGLVRSVGLSLRDAYLVIPLVPAFLLGAVAVWSAVRSRAD
jgi:hypothetical protein